jgi:outer membrane receptor protein involved in Fe transport
MAEPFKLRYRQLESGRKEIFMKKREKTLLSRVLTLCVYLLVCTLSATTTLAGNILHSGSNSKTTQDNSKVDDQTKGMGSTGLRDNSKVDDQTKGMGSTGLRDNSKVDDQTKGMGSTGLRDNSKVDDQKGSKGSTRFKDTTVIKDSTKIRSAKTRTVGTYVNLNEVILSASFVKERQSPLRLTTIERKEIERKAIGLTYPELLKEVPGVYATSESGSYGDAKINIRGFKQENISVMLNGIPISGLVTGNMFWNNWLGLIDATHSIQVQKGIGGSMLSDNSVGGTINIITKTADSQPSASAGLFFTSYGQAKSFISVNTGQNSRGWALSAMTSYAWGKGYPDATDVSSWAYLVNISKVINSKHSLLFTALGSPERHQQRSARLSATEIETYGLHYNKNWGYLNSEPKNISENFYHKPYLTLHHLYKPGNKTEVTNTAYLSTGHGGGRWSESKGKRIIDYRKDGLIDWDAVISANIQGVTGASSNILSDYIAGHTQAGFKSNITHNPDARWSLGAGLHYQYYYTWEKEIITDLLGGGFWLEDYATKSMAGLAGRDPVKRVGDYIRTNNGKTINHLTIYSTANFRDERWDIRLGASAMGSTNRRWDKYNYIDNIYSESANAAGYSLKAGATRKINMATSVYLNAGVYSRVPYNDVFFSSGNNNITDDVKNEKNLLSEVGFRYIFQRGSIEITGYYALWKNKSIISNPYAQPDNSTLRYMIRGLDALHYGTEINADWRATRRLKLDVNISLAKWRWKNDVSANIYDDYSGILQGVVNVYSNNLPVGDAPQTQLNLSAEFTLAKGLTLNADWRYNARMYADFDPKDRQNPNDRADPFKVPDYSVTNAGLNWIVGRGKLNTTLYVNVNNIFNSKYIERGRDGSDHTLNSFRGFWGIGRNAGAGVRFQF